MKKILKVILILKFILPLSEQGNLIDGQILKDSASISLVKVCVENIYNFNFKEAEEAFLKIKLSYPGHPVIYLIDGMLTYWKSYPLVTTSENRQIYEDDLRTCIDLCENKPQPGNDTEYLLANLCARGLLLLFYADNDLSRNVIPLAASTYKYVKRSFNYTDTLSDFYFFTGLYNYYREAYPDAHPVYKPLAALFPKGDREKGLSELKRASNTSILLRAESTAFLFYISHSFENNFSEALKFNEILHARYPSNEQYTGDLIKSLLLEKRYNEAEKLISEQSSETTGQYLGIQIIILRGVLQEKKYKNYQMASQYYNSGLESIGQYGDFADDVASVAYLGLSRIAEINGDTREMINLRKKGMNLTTFKVDPFSY